MIKICQLFNFQFYDVIEVSPSERSIFVCKKSEAALTIWTNNCEANIGSVKVKVKYFVIYSFPLNWTLEVDAWLEASPNVSEIFSNCMAI